MNRPQTKRLLKKALHYAILWEDSLIDANVHGGNRKQLREMQANIKMFTEMLDAVAPNRAMTMGEYLDSLLVSGKAKMMTLEEIKATTDSKGDSE